ncbi:MAG TPA: GGDEF domain-containing protein [Steroidobacteraceae bacterium]
MSTFPDSPYAAELRTGASKLRFSQPQLEADYRRSRLQGSRTLIRVACVFAAAVAAVRGAEEIFAHAWDRTLWIGCVLVVASSLALTWIAWSSAFERLYPHWARIVVPLRNSIIAVQVAAAAARGQPEMLMALPITLIGAFFFLGLTCRAAFVCCGLTVASYVIAATWLHLPPLLALHSYVLLAGGVAACVIAILHLERISRQSFLEGGLIAELAQRDPLTGTRNRRVFDEHLELLWQQAVVNGRGLALLLIDIDHFKAYNDFYGHQAGDLALRQVAQTIQKLIHRPLDILTRYGGEEFAVILYDVDDRQAWDIAERIRAVVGELNIEHRASGPFSRVTISVGVAALKPTAERSPSGALQLADQALYEAKRLGRNCVEFMGDLQHDMLETGVFAISAAPSQKPGLTQGRAASIARPAQLRRGSGG